VAPPPAWAEVAQAPEAAPITIGATPTNPRSGLIHADPVAGGAVDWSALDDGPAAVPTSTSVEMMTPRRLVEPRVWGGRSASDAEDDARLLNLLCPDGSPRCRERVRERVRRTMRKHDRR
jgi:hypothetical protein